jgi:hypothetical protein
VIRPLTRADVDRIRPLADESTAEGFRFVVRFLEEAASPAFALDEPRHFFFYESVGYRPTTEPQATHRRESTSAPAPP